MMSNLAMFVIMMIASLLSTMNVWADKIGDIRWSFNDIYMALLMTGWMFLLMGLYSKDYPQITIGLPLIILSLICIRYQLFINPHEYVRGMIPHHSMAVHMSRKLLERSDLSTDLELKSFAQNLINNQGDEIRWLKMRE